MIFIFLFTRPLSLTAGRNSIEFAVGIIPNGGIGGRKWLQGMEACIFVILDDFIIFYKPFVAKSTPAVFLLFGKKYVPRFVEHGLLSFGIFS